MSDVCGQPLMEDDWPEGYHCSLVRGHDGPHRDASPENRGKDNRGRAYEWTYEWRFTGND